MEPAAAASLRQGPDGPPADAASAAARDARAALLSSGLLLLDLDEPTAGRTSTETNRAVEGEQRQGTESGGDEGRHDTGPTPPPSDAALAVGRQLHEQEQEEEQQDIDHESRSGPLAPIGFTPAEAYVHRAQRTVFFAKCAPAATADAVARVFETFGGVEEVNLFRQWPSAKASRGCGLVVMATEEGASAAIEGLHGLYTWEGVPVPMVAERCCADRLGVKAATQQAARARKSAAAAAARQGSGRSGPLSAVAGGSGGAGVSGHTAGLPVPGPGLLGHHRPSTVSAPLPRLSSGTAVPSGAPRMQPPSWQQAGPPQQPQQQQALLQPQLQPQPPPQAYQQTPHVHWQGGAALQQGPFLQQQQQQQQQPQHWQLQPQQPPQQPPQQQLYMSPLGLIDGSDPRTANSAPLPQARSPPVGHSGGLAVLSSPLLDAAAMHGRAYSTGMPMGSGGTMAPPGATFLPQHAALPQLQHVQQVQAQPQQLWQGTAAATPYGAHNIAVAGGLSDASGSLASGPLGSGALPAAPAGAAVDPPTSGGTCTILLQTQNEVALVCENASALAALSGAALWLQSGGPGAGALALTGAPLQVAAAAELVTRLLATGGTGGGGVAAGALWGPSGGTWSG